MICVYKILSPDLQECYVGSTTNYTKRKSKHKKNKDCTSEILFEKYGFDNCKFVVLEQCTKEELKNKEQWWMDHSVGLVNTKRAFITKEERKEQQKEQQKEYRQANKEKIREKNKAYCELKKQIKNLA